MKVLYDERSSAFADLRLGLGHRPFGESKQISKVSRKSGVIQSSPTLHPGTNANKIDNSYELQRSVELLPRDRFVLHTTKGNKVDLLVSIGLVIALAALPQVVIFLISGETYTYAEQEDKSDYNWPFRNSWMSIFSAAFSKPAE